MYVIQLSIIYAKKDYVAWLLENILQYILWMVIRLEICGAIYDCYWYSTYNECLRGPRLSFIFVISQYVSLFLLSFPSLPLSLFFFSLSTDEILLLLLTLCVPIEIILFISLFVTHFFFFFFVKLLYLFVPFVQMYWNTISNPSTSFYIQPLLMLNSDFI